MGADWYEPFIIYGCEFDIPADTRYRKFLQELLELNDIIEKPFKITGMLSSFHSRMEGSDNTDMDDSAVIVIGFTPDNNLEKTMEVGKKLYEYIIDNPIFMGFDIVGSPKFHCGIEWNHEPDEDSDEDDEFDEEEDDEEDEEQTLSSNSSKSVNKEKSD